MTEKPFTLDEVTKRAHDAANWLRESIEAAQGAYSALDEAHAAIGSIREAAENEKIGMATLSEMITDKAVRAECARMLREWLSRIDSVVSWPTSLMLLADRMERGE